MIDVDKPIIKYSVERLQRYPHDLLVFKHGLETIGSIQLKYDNEKLWQKAIDFLNQLKIE